MFKLVVLLSVAVMATAKPGFVTPVGYSAVLPGLSSISQYSSSVVHGSPSVYTSPAFYGAPAFYSAPYYHTAGVVPTLAQAPNQPAVVLDAVNGVPLDTPEVVAARAAHYNAKALAPFHHLRKRSVGVAPLTYSSVVSPISYSSPLVSPYSVSPLVSTYSSPLLAHGYGYSHLYPRAYSVHPY